MKTIIRLVTIVVIIILFTNCRKDKLLPKNRSFYMGFTPLAYDFNEIAKSNTYDFIQSHSDIISHHIDPFGVPWEEAYTGSDFPLDVEQEIQYRISHTNVNQKIFLSVTALALDRVSINNYWGENTDVLIKNKWENKPFNDPDLIAAYLNFCRRMIDRFQPDYFAYMIEANYNFKTTDPDFNDFVYFCDTVYQTLKVENPSLPVFITMTSGALNNKSIEDMWEVNKLLIPYSDMVAVSTYPYMLGTPPSLAANPKLIRQDWLTKMQDLAPNKPFAISETAYLAQDFEISGILYYPGTENWQNEYVKLLMEQANKLNAEFVIWFVPYDLDQGVQALEAFGITDADPFATKAWENTGLVDGKNVPRMSLRTWDSWYELLKN